MGPKRKRVVSTTNESTKRKSQACMAQFVKKAIVDSSSSLLPPLQNPVPSPHPPPSQDAKEKVRQEASLVPYVPMPYGKKDYPDLSDLYLSEAARRAHPFFKYGGNSEEYEPDSVRDNVWFCVLEFSHKEAIGARSQSENQDQNSRRRRPIHEDSPENDVAYVGPRVEITGVTPDGTTICVVAEGFEPYCYASIPEEWILFCNNDIGRLQQLCLRWYAFMDEFFMRVVRHVPGFKRYRNCLYNGHVLLPLTEEERRRGIVLTDVKDIKVAMMDYTAKDEKTGENKPKHLINYMVRLRVASPKLLTLVRQHLWYPLGVDGAACALCGNNDPSKPLINSPYFPAKDDLCVQELLGEDYMNREKNNEWTDVVRDKCGCAARFHGQCLKNWARAHELRRADRTQKTEFIYRCPCCTSDVIKIASCPRGFRQPKPPLPSLAELDRIAQNGPVVNVGGNIRQSTGNYNQRRNLNADEQEELDLYGLIDDALLYNSEEPGAVNSLHDAFPRNTTVVEMPWQDEVDQDVENEDGSKADDWNSQCDLYGWYSEFARLEHSRYGRYPPAPQPTEAQEWEAKLRAQKTGTLPYPSSMTVCDANVGFCERFAVDNRIAPTSWIQIACGKYTVIPPDDVKRSSICALEIHCDSGALERLVNIYKKKPPQDSSKDTPEWRKARELYRLDIPPILTIVYDGEMSPDNGRFPHPHVNQTLQWGALVHNMRTGHLVSVLFTLGEISQPPKPAQPDIPCFVHSYRTEVEFLRAICMFFRVLRPSCHIHWNGNSFDLPWLYERSRHLGLCCARDFGSRIRNKDMFWKTGQGAGKRLITQVTMAGTVCLDGMLFAQVERPTLSSYSLNTLGELLLNQFKVDLDHERIPEMQLTADGRAGLSEYLLGDIYLTWRICIAMNMLPNLAQRSQLTYTSIQNLIQRGTQYMELNLLRQRLHRKFMNRFYGLHINTMALPTMRPPRLDPILLARKGRNAEYDGAVVIEPVKGFYQQVVFTLDYASLYPSVMCNYNLCLSTFVPPLLAERYGVQPEQHTWQRPSHVFHKDHIDEVPCVSNPIFLKPSVFAGVFPEILKWLKSKRKAVKREMAGEENLLIGLKRDGKTHAPDGRPLAQIAARIKILDIIQNQIKLVMNSVYGFMGLHRTRGQAALPSIAETVTLMGQHAIHTARITTELYFSRTNGYRFSLGIIYGDTDSVFGRIILDGTHETLELARNVYFMIEVGTLMAKCVTIIFKEGLELQFEKVYYPLCLLEKKCYVGLKIEPNGSVKIDKKGIRTKRRDCCDMQRDATLVFEQHIIKNYNFNTALDEISAILVRIERYEEPIHRAVFSGSFSSPLLEMGRDMNAAAMAMFKEYKRTGQVAQPGNRVLYVFVETARLNRDFNDGIYAVKDNAETLDYVQQQGLRYDRADYIDRVIKSIITPMSHVAAAEWNCSFVDAKKRLNSYWLAQVRKVTICERISSTPDGNFARLLTRGFIRVHARCVQCKCTLSESTESGKNSMDSSVVPRQTFSPALTASLRVSDDVQPDCAISRYNVKSLGGAIQLRVRSKRLDELLTKWVPHNQWVYIDANERRVDSKKDQTSPPMELEVRQLRTSGNALMRTLNMWNGGRPSNAQDQEPPRLCIACQSKEEERTHERVRLENEFLSHSKIASEWWDKCRSCSAARMRSADTVAQCTTYKCDRYSYSSHQTRKMSRTSTLLRERWPIPPETLDW
jgi:DNA polymerase elongation subunit (family B)